MEFVAEFKTGEIVVEAGGSILVHGSHTAHLFTMLDGWAFRYKTLDDGRRQVLNYLLPGDLVGLQGNVLGEMDHSIEALTDTTMCMFERRRLDELFVKHPQLAYDITWLAAQEERFLDEHLLSIGRRSAIERTAYLIAFLYFRLKEINGEKKENGRIPITQQLIADTLGLSIVHTNKTIRKLINRKLIKWRDRGCDVLDAEGLTDLAKWEYEPPVDRPFL